MTREIAALGGALLLLASCGKEAARDLVPPPRSAPEQTRERGMEDGPALIGAPYQVGRMTYTPADTPRYDEVGYAGLMENMPGSPTANGERFEPAAIGAAHKTLPLPSYVEVTAIDTGKTILVRVNDRGPMDNGLILALSPGAAAQLVMGDTRMVPVRVRRVNPPDQEKSVLQRGGRAAERLEPPKPLLAVLRSRLGPPPVLARPAPVVATAAPARPALPPSRAATASVPLPSRPAVAPPPREDGFIVEQADARGALSPVRDRPANPAPAPAVASRTVPAPAERKSGYVVQVAAFADEARARSTAGKLHGSAERAGKLWRVRLGPYANRDAAQAGVKQAAAAGFNGARIMVND